MRNKFLLLARADYRKNHKKMALILGMLLLFLFSVYLNSGDFDIGGNVLLASLQCVPAVMVFLYVMLSLSFRDYQGNERFLHALLPVSQKEKYAYLFIRNLLFLPFVIFLIYYTNHSVWEIVFGKEYHLVMNRGDNFILNGALNCFLFFLSGVLFKRLQVVYGFLMICAVPLVLLPILTKRISSIVSVLFDPGIIPYNLCSYRYIEIVAMVIALGITYWAWVKFKSLQIR